MVNHIVIVILRNVILNDFLVRSVYDIPRCRKNATIRGTVKDSSHVHENQNLHIQVLNKFLNLLSIRVISPFSAASFHVNCFFLGSSEREFELKFSLKYLVLFCKRCK